MAYYEFKKASKFLLSQYTYGLNSTSFQNFRITMGDVELEMVKSVKYLGVMLDDQVTWAIKSII